jgi:thioredoxin reductase (NADPH)
MLYDLICIGAGPTGLATAIEARRAGLRPLVIDRGCLCNSLYRYPVQMVFFTTAERMEIGGLPLVTAGTKPTRAEALKYYRRAAEHYELEVRLGEELLTIEGHDEHFRVYTRTQRGERSCYRGRKVVLATGYYDQPNALGVPGEDLPHVTHYYTEAHPYWRRRVVVIGGRNSAAEAALDLFRNGAYVTLIHRGSSLGPTVKYWLRPDLENRIRAGEIQAVFNARVLRIEPEHVLIDVDGRQQTVQAEQVFAMTGYHPHFDLLRSLGIELEPETLRPRCDPDTLETNVPGLFLAGVLVGGRHTAEIFIENGRFHGQKIVAGLTGRLLEATEPTRPLGE